MESAGVAHRQILLSVATDVALDGTPSEHWLIATPESLAVVQDAQPAIDCENNVLTTCPWSEIQDVRTLSGVGSGRLQIRRADTWIDLLRFSNAHAQRFHKVSRQLDHAAELVREMQESLEPKHFAITSAPLDPPHCPTCKLRIPSEMARVDVPGDTPSCPRCMQRGRIVARVWELVAPYRNGALMLCVLTMFGVGAELVPPKLQQYMVDHILMSSAAGEVVPQSVDFRTALLVVVLALAASRLMLSTVSFLNGRLATRIGCGLTGRLRDELVTKLSHLSVAYYDRHNTGSIISRVSHDSEALHGLMHQFTGGFLLQAVKLFGVGGMLMWINPKLALFTLIPVPMVLLGSWVFWNRVYPRYYRLRDASAKQMSTLNGLLHGIRVVKAFGQEDREYERFHDASERLKKWRLWVDVTNSGYAASMQIVFSLGGLIVWYVGGLDVIGNDMTLGELIAFLAYLAMFYAPLNALSSFTTWLTSFLSGSKRVFELLDTPSAIGESKTPVSLPSPKGLLKFENVTFGYDPNQPVIKDVSFEVAAGEMIGIVGRSGSGKTTLVNLLTRFYDVQEGRITIDGHDVRDIASKDLRDHVGIVLQDSFLFRGTIYKNLKYGRPDVATDTALEAAKAAGAHDFICRQSLAYDTTLGQRGAGLSGGEKQRLSIARTLLYDPRVLILDEATSNIDAESEKLIQDALEELTVNRTTVAIAHRLSTLRNADRILVFDRGTLIEQGTHAELIESDRQYAKMVRIQMQVSKDPNVDKLLDESADNSNQVDVSNDLAKCGVSKGKPHESSAKTQELRSKLRWLDPTEVHFTVNAQNQIGIEMDGGETHESVFCIRLFPARDPGRFISVRRWSDSGDDEEIGILRDLDELQERDQAMVGQSLKRHYLIREIQRVHKVKLNHGYLDMDIQTENGPEQLTMRWTASQAIDFGERGKLLTDTEDNRFLVTDVERLPKPDRERFQQYVYW